MNTPTPPIIKAAKVNASALVLALVSVRKQLAAEEAKGELANPRTLFKYRDVVATRQSQLDAAMIAWGCALVATAEAKKK